MFTAGVNPTNRETQQGRDEGAGDQNQPGPSVLSRVSTHSTRLGELERKIQRLETNIEGVERIPETDSDSNDENGKI